MNCEYTFTVGGGKLKLSQETDLISSYIDEDVVLVLRSANKTDKNFFKNLIQEGLRKVDNLDNAKLKNLRKGNVMYNTNIETLKREFPDIDFPIGMSANILLIDNFVAHGKEIRGRIINSNGDEVFVIQGKNKQDLKDLAAFLLLKKIAEENSFRFDKKSENYKDLLNIMEIRNRRLRINKLDTPLDLILDFQSNASKYRDIWFGDDNKKNAYYILANIRNLILSRAGRTSFDNNLVNNLYQMSLYLGKGNILFRDIDIYNILSGDEEFKKLFEILKIKKALDFRSILDNINLASIENNEDRKIVQSILFSNEELTATENLLNYIFDKEPTFLYSFKKKTGNGFVYYFLPKTINNKYGIEYDTIYSMDLEDNYKGFKIFKWLDSRDNKVYYIPSRGYLTEDSFSKRQNSIKEARKYIDNYISNLNILKGANLEFKFRKYNSDGTVDPKLDSYSITSNLYIIPGQIIESLDIPINPKLEWYSLKEKDIIEFGKTLQTFYNVVNSYNIDYYLKNRIIKEVDTPEKAAIFLYKINEIAKGDRNNSENFDTVLNIIENAKIQNYYIELRKYKYKKWEYNIIPINDPNDIVEYRRNKNYPIIKFMQAVQEHLKGFGVSVQLKTASEIKEQFPNIDANISKAFIDNGIIYINTSIANVSDLIHEYTHLLLGILRSNPELRSNYEKMLQRMMETSKKAQNTFKHLSNIYGDRSNVDIMEEVFVKLFSSYVRLGMNLDLSNMFESETMKKGALLLFNEKINNVKIYFGNVLSSLFKAFNQNIKNLLENSDLLDFDMTKTSRRYSTWISNKLNSTNDNDKLIEECI